MSDAQPPNNVIFSLDEYTAFKQIVYRIEYPFHAIDSTLRFTLWDIAQQANATAHREQPPITTGTVRYMIIYPAYRVQLTLYALDTRLCALRIVVPDDGTIPDMMLQGLAEDIAARHDTFVANIESADVLLRSADRARGGRDTWPEDAVAIARLQAGHDRETVKRDWLKSVARNRKRKKIADPDNRFRQLVLKANRS